MVQASVLQTIQLGLEVTKGTVVPANKKLGSLSIDPALQTNIDTFAPAGQKYAAFTSLNQEWVSAALSGKPTYTELPLLLSSVIKKVTSAEIATSGAYEWVFESSVDDADDPQTFTVEQVGTEGLAQRFAYGLITDFGMNVSRTTTDLNGTMIAQQYTSGITPTASPTAIDLVPILPSHFSIYMDDTAVALGTTKLLRDFVANLSIGGKFGPIWALNRAQGSYSGHVDLAPTVTLQLQMERSAVGFTPLAKLREGSSAFIRVEAVGGEAGTGENYSSVLDFAGQVSATSFGDTDGLAVVDWTFTTVVDPTWEKAFTWTVVNEIETY